MSIVGPRPLLVEYLPYYTEEEHENSPCVYGYHKENGGGNDRGD